MSQAPAEKLAARNVETYHLPNSTLHCNAIAGYSYQALGVPGNPAAFSTALNWAAWEMAAQFCANGRTAAYAPARGQ